VGSAISYLAARHTRLLVIAEMAVQEPCPALALRQIHEYISPGSGRLCTGLGAIGQERSSIQTEAIVANVRLYLSDASVMP